MSWYKTSLAVFVAITPVVIYLLWPPLAPPGEWMRHLTSAHAIVVDIVRNNSAEIFGIVLGSYPSSANTSSTTDLVTASPEGPEV